MKAGLLEEVRETALRMGAGVPRWLQEGRVPEFCTKEAGIGGAYSYTTPWIVRGGIQLGFNL